MAGHKNWRKSGGKSLFKDERTINKIKSVKSEQNLAVKKKNCISVIKVQKCSVFSFWQRKKYNAELNKRM